MKTKGKNKSQSTYEFVDQDSPCGNIVSLKSFIERIRHFPSPDPSVLPQRSNFAFVDVHRPVRDINRDLYKKLYKEFLDTYMSEGLLHPGIYFLFDYYNSTVKFYYIGISGTKRNPNRPLWERIEEHLKNKDIIFYSIAFPERIEIYRNETKIFYEDGNYSGKKDEYKRQFDALKVTTIKYIAWISHTIFDYATWDAVETFFISQKRPPANFKKIDASPNMQYSPQFEVIKNYFFDNLVEQLNRK